MQATSRYLPYAVFWLLPQIEERRKIQTIITALAERFSAPQFVPHVATYSCWRSAQLRELAVMAGLAAVCRPIVMGSLGLASQDRLIQAMHVQCPINPAITA